MKKILASALAVLLAVSLAAPLSGCRSRARRGPAPEPPPQAEPAQHEPAPPVETKKTIRVTGQAAAKAGPDGSVSTQAKLMAKRGAQLDAYRQLNEQVLGLQIDSQTSVRDFVAQSDEIRTSTEGFIKEIQPLSNEYLEGEGIAECVVELEVAELFRYLRSLK